MDMDTDRRHEDEPFVGDHDLSGVQEIEGEERPAMPSPGAQQEASADPGISDDELAQDDAAAVEADDDDYVGEDDAYQQGGEFSSDFSDSKPLASESDSYEDSDSDGMRKRKRKKTRKAMHQKKKEERPRADTAMTRKLRSTGSAYEEAMDHVGSKSNTNLSARRPTPSDSQPPYSKDSEGDASDDSDGGGNGSEDFNPDADLMGGPITLERQMDEEQAAKDLESVKGMWQWASICEFLYMFREQLQLKTVFSMDSLADAIVRSPGPGLLAELHVELLGGIIHNRKSLCEETWVAFLANRLAYERVGLVHKQPSPFKPAKRQEALEYAALPVENRVLALKELCDVRLDRDDLRGLVDESLKPPPKLPKKPPAPPPPQASRRSSRSSTVQPQIALQKKAAQSVHKTPDDYRKDPVGLDSSGNAYWLLDMWDVAADDGGLNYGTVLFKERPPSDKVIAPPKPDSEEPASPTGKKKKGKSLSQAEQRYRRLAAYQIPEPVESGPWQPIAASVSEMEEVGLKLKRSLKAPDANVASTILDQVIPSLNERFEMEERQKRARERTAKQLGSGFWGLEVGGRSMRQRKQITYNTDAYDNAIRQAIRAGSNYETQREQRSRAAELRSGSAAYDSSGSIAHEPVRSTRNTRHEAAAAQRLAPSNLEEEEEEEEEEGRVDVGGEDVPQDDFSDREEEARCEDDDRDVSMTDGDQKKGFPIQREYVERPDVDARVNAVAASLLDAPSRGAPPEPLKSEPLKSELVGVPPEPLKSEPGGVPPEEHIPPAVGVVAD